MAKDDIDEFLDATPEVDEIDSFLDDLPSKSEGALDQVPNAKDEFNEFRKQRLEESNQPIAKKLLNKGIVEPVKGGASILASLAKTGYGAGEDLVSMQKNAFLDPLQNAKNVGQTAIEAGSRAVGDLGEMGRSVIKDPFKFTNPVTSLILKSLAKPTEAGIEKDFVESKYQELSEKNRKNSAPVNIPGAVPYENAAEAGSMLIDPQAVGGVLAGKMGLKMVKKLPPIAKKGPDQVIKEAGDGYREILAPKKGNIKNVEIKAGKDLDDSYELAAKEGLIIKKSSDNKLDTLDAIEQLKEPSEAIHNQLSDALASKPNKRFNLREQGEKAKSQMRDMFDNDAEYEAALKQVDEEIEAAIRQRGENVSGVELNAVKKGMWSKGYNALAPNSNKVARRIGNAIKNTIEESYDDANIKGLNAKLGEYSTLRKLLEDSHGNVVARGKLGKYVAQGIGAVIGAPVPVIGSMGGGWLGGKISDYLVNPERLTSKMAKKVSKLPQKALPPALPSQIKGTSQFQPVSERIPLEVLLEKKAQREKAQAILEQLKRDSLLRKSSHST